MAKDIIFIKDLLVRGIVGTKEEERREKQDIVINIELESDLSKPAETDSIEDAVNYRTVSKMVIEIVEKSTFFLVEALANKIANSILSTFENVERVKVSVEKPGALRFAKSVGVVITKGRD